MPNHHHSPHAEIEAIDSQSEATGGAALSTDALARRRMLLKSLGKGTSVAAAVAAGSMHTLASATTLTFTASGSRCTISGTISGIHSKDTTKDTCRGRHPTVFKTANKWPPTNNGSGTYTVDNKTFSPTSTFTSVFGSGSGNTLQTILNATTLGAVSDEAAWITALLNSLPNSGALNFPYPPSKVLYFYSSTSEKAGALTFFKNYMQTVVS
jgi:hypothetical protein